MYICSGLFCYIVHSYLTVIIGYAYELAAMYVTQVSDNLVEVPDFPPSISKVLWENIPIDKVTLKAFCCLMWILKLSCSTFL